MPAMTENLSGKSLSHRSLFLSCDHDEYVWLVIPHAMTLSRWLQKKDNLLVVNMKICNACTRSGIDTDDVPVHDDVRAVFSLLVMPLFTFLVS